MAEKSARAALEASNPAKAFSSDANLVGAWMKTQNSLVPWGRINPFAHVVFYDDIPWDTVQRSLPVRIRGLGFRVEGFRI